MKGASLYLKVIGFLELILDLCQYRCWKGDSCLMGSYLQQIVCLALPVLLPEIELCIEQVFHLGPH